MHLETPIKTVSKSSKEVFDFLSDIKNFEKLMPENISKFEILNENRFLFALKGMPEIVLQKKQETPNSQVVLGAASEKLPFTLTADIKEIDANKSEVSLSFEGDFNPMMAMMIKSPITNFIGTLSDNLSKL
ncbi:SRPBCC family protein [Arenibacter sp. 6A1]|uniref:SRPBCC family protein n=1 Tax=Arenibacter sp. 6A1 TaxID=2720391 RepID=UPI0014459A7C|nr:SRPBCC family protein [Arenibacter sp. 6A1]NKI28062.1 SRPBCC family protein [Arenibacter sp. 6A1]